MVLKQNFPRGEARRTHGPRPARAFLLPPDLAPPAILEKGTNVQPGAKLAGPPAPTPAVPVVVLSPQHGLLSDAARILLSPSTTTGHGLPAPPPLCTRGKLIKMPICLCPTLKEIASPCPWDQGQAPHCIGTAQPLHPLLPIPITDVHTPQVLLLGVAPSPSASLCWAKLPFSGVSLKLSLPFSRLS